MIDSLFRFCACEPKFYATAKKNYFRFLTQLYSHCSFKNFSANRQKPARCPRFFYIAPSFLGVVVIVALLLLIFATVVFWFYTGVFKNIFLKK